MAKDNFLLLAILGIGAALAFGLRNRFTNVSSPSVPSNSIVEEVPAMVEPVSNPQPSEIDALKSVRDDVAARLAGFGFIAGDQPAAAPNRPTNQAKQVKFLPKGVIFNSTGVIGFTDRAGFATRERFAPDLAFTRAIEQQAANLGYDPIGKLLSLQEQINTRIQELSV